MADTGEAPLVQLLDELQAVQSDEVAAPDAPASAAAAAPALERLALKPLDAGVFLELDVSLVAPPNTQLFVGAANDIRLATVPGQVDLAVTGAERSTTLDLKPGEQARVSLPVQAGEFLDDKLCVSHRAKINVKFNEIAVGVNGTIAPTYGGDGYVYVGKLMEYGVVGAPLSFGTSPAHSAVVILSNPRLRSDARPLRGLVLSPEPETEKTLDLAVDSVNKYIQGAVALRQQVVFKAQPLLSKTVARAQGGGIRDEGWDLLHTQIRMKLPFGEEALEAILEHAVSTELSFDQEAIDELLTATASPGIAAAKRMDVFASAVSVGVGFLMPYKADESVLVSANGLVGDAAESWLRSRGSALEQDDCDGSAALSRATLHSAADWGAKSGAGRFTRALRNALVPYYTPLNTVLAAKGAEASGGGDHSVVAGHAITSVLPTGSLLAALRRGGGEELHAARFAAVFGAETGLPEAETAALAAGRLPEGAEALAKLAIEGTVPSSSLLFELDHAKRDETTQQAAAEKAALDSVSPNVGRSMKILHASPMGHAFYHSLVEVSLGADHPLFASKPLRELSGAASQFVLVNESGHAGATPRQLAEDDFRALPLQTVGTAAAEAFDLASEISDRNVMPPRAEPYRLTAEQVASLDRARAAMEKLKRGSGGIGGCVVAYTLSLATLVFNPLGVEHFAERVGSKSGSVAVDTKEVPGLLVGPEGEPVSAPFFWVCADARA